MTTDQTTNESGSLLEKLGDHLKAEKTVHSQLLLLAEKKREHIVGGNITSLSDVIKQEQAVAEQGAQLSHIRSRLISALARHLEEDPNTLQLAHILERAPEPLRSELNDIQLDLRDVLTRLREVNDRNMILIRQSLSFVREILDVIGGNAARDGYGHNGEDQTANKAGGGGLVNFQA